MVVEEAADAGFNAPEGFEELERRSMTIRNCVFARILAVVPASEARPDPYSAPIESCGV